MFGRVAATRLTGDGPLNTGDQVTTTARPVEVGLLVGWGDTWISNPGEGEIILTGAHLVEPGEQPLSIVQIGVNDPYGGRGAVGFDDWSISHRPLEPLPFTLKPGVEVQVVFVLNAEAEGRIRANGVMVDYTVNGQSYAERAHRSFLMCAPDVGNCPLDDQ